MSTKLSTQLPSINQLPQSYIIKLNHWGAISLSGAEQSSYLQGQVTCDVNTLTDSNILLGAHCNAKGKVFACFRLVNHLGEHLLLQPKSTIDASLTELKKFGVFAKVEINQAEQLSLYAIAGNHAEKVMLEIFDKLPTSSSPVSHEKQITAIYINGSTPRYMLIGEEEPLTSLISQLQQPIVNEQVWDLLEINQGIPKLSAPAIAQYVPQMLNMQAINGISFTKGCYLGQETVARMQYLGKNKKALFSLTGQLTASINELIIERQLGENWRKAGDVLCSYSADNNEIFIQAVLPNDIDNETPLRLQGQDSATLSLVELPYSLSSESE